MQVTEIAVPGPASRTPAEVGSESVPVRRYAPEGTPWATLVWAHGGSFVHGTLDWPEADWTSRRFAEAGILVYSVDYGVATKSVKAPGPSNDVAAVLRRVAEETTGPVAVGGASAGGQLAVLAALDQAASGSRRPSALLLEYPTLHRVQLPNAAIAAATKDLPERRRFGADRIAAMYDFYLGSGEAPVAGELPPETLAELPPTIIVNADRDDLRASGEQFGEQLRRAGVPAAVHVQPGTVHGYLNRPEESEQSLRDARATIDTFVAELRGILAR